MAVTTRRQTGRQSLSTAQESISATTKNDSTETTRATASRRPKRTTPTTTTSSTTTEKKMTPIQIAHQLMKSHDPSLWEYVDNHYSNMLLQKGGEKLQQLDEELRKFFIDKTKDISNGKAEITFSSKMLYKVVEWKFSIGKPRPLMKLLKSNSNEDVQTCFTNSIQVIISTSAFASSEAHFKSTMNELIQLKGVGPATASAILSFSHPAFFCFMADEVIDCLKHGGKRDYTMKTYLDMNRTCCDMATHLSRNTKCGNSTKNDNNTSWDAARVGRTLWTVMKIGASATDCKERTLLLKKLENVKGDVVAGAVSTSDDENDCFRGATVTNKRQKIL